MQRLRQRRPIRWAALAVLTGLLVATSAPGGATTLAFDDETNPGKPTCSLCQA
jgi:hypothetical protein